MGSSIVQGILITEYKIGTDQNTKPTIAKVNRTFLVATEHKNVNTIFTKFDSI
jgi:hypothetical protein